MKRICNRPFVANDRNDPECRTHGVYKGGPLTLTVFALAVKQLAATKFNSSRGARGDIGNLEVRRPLQGEGLVFRGACPQTDDRCALIVGQIVTPERGLPCRQDLRVKAEFPLMLRHRNICTEDSTHAARKRFSHYHVT